MPRYTSFNEISKKLGELSSRVERIENDVKSLASDLKFIEWKLDSIVRRDLNPIRYYGLWKRSYCIYYNDKEGYCSYWYWKDEVKLFEMRKDTVNGRTVYRISVVDYPTFCALCPYYVVRSKISS